MEGGGNVRVGGREEGRVSDGGGGEECEGGREGGRKGE